MKINWEVKAEVKQQNHDTFAAWKEAQNTMEGGEQLQNKNQRGFLLQEPQSNKYMYNGK